MATIGIDASRANVEQRTGTEWYIYNLLQELKTIIPADKYQVILYTKEPLRNDFADLPSNWSNRTLRWPPQLLWTQLRLSLTMLWPKSRPDILFIPAHTIPIIHPSKTIYVAHDLGFERFQELYSRAFIGGRIMDVIVRVLTLGMYGTNELDYHRWSMNFAIKHSSKIIAISQFTKNELANVYNVTSNKVTVVHNGFTAEQYKPTENKTPKDPYILFVGRLEHKKNMVNLVKAFGILKKQYKIKHKLKLVGSPGYGYEDMLESINKNELTDEVIIPGYIDQAKMPELISSADLFVFPSQYEGFGIPILEALACNTLVACSDIEPLREVGGAACRYFKQNEPESIARVIYATLQLPETEKQAIRMVGQKRVQQFSWNKCANETWQVIKSVLELT